MPIVYDFVIADFYSLAVSPYSFWMKIQNSAAAVVVVATATTK